MCSGGADFSISFDWVSWNTTRPSSVAPTTTIKGGDGIMKRIIVAGLLLAWRRCGRRRSARVSLHKILATAGMKNPLREDRQRPIDPRLTKLETEGTTTSGLFPGKIHLVHNAKEIHALSEQVNPGDQVALTGSDWKDTRQIKFAAHGTEQAPILIRAEKPGGVVSIGATVVL